MAAERAILERGLIPGPFILWGRENHRVHRAGVRRRGTAFFQIVFVEDGRVPYTLDGQTFHPTAPFGLLVQPGAAFEIALPTGITWHLLAFDAVYQPLRRPRRAMAPGTFGPYCHRSKQSQPSGRRVWKVDLPVKVPGWAVDSGLHCIRWCNARWWRSEDDYGLACHRLGLWLLDLVAGCRPAGAPVVTWIDQLRAYCIHQMPHGLSVADLAQHAGMSRQHLRRRLLETVSMTPKQFVDETRIAQACRLLRSTDWPVSRIGDRCGYSSTATFIRGFRRRRGATPLKWRNGLDAGPARPGRGGG